MLEISPADIAEIEECGELNGSPVKMIKTTGGYYIAIGKDAKGKMKPIGTGPHKAICEFMIEKMNPGFRPLIVKNEGDNPEVTDLTKNLDEDIIARGYNLYAVKENEYNSKVVLSHHLAEVASVDVLVYGDLASMSAPVFNSDYRVSGLRKSFYEGVLSVAEKEGANKVSVTKEDGSHMCMINLDNK